MGTLLGALANLTADALEVAEESGAKLGTHAAMLEEAALDLFDELAQ